LREEYKSRVQVIDFRVVMLCNEVGYQHFRGPCCLHLHPEDGLGLCAIHVCVANTECLSPLTRLPFGKSHSAAQFVRMFVWWRGNVYVSMYIM